MKENLLLLSKFIIFPFLITFSGVLFHNQVNVIARLEFELSYNDITGEHVNHYAKETNNID